MNDSSASCLRNNFVDHGTLTPLLPCVRSSEILFAHSKCSHTPIVGDLILVVHVGACTNCGNKPSWFLIRFTPFLLQCVSCCFKSPDGLSMRRSGKTREQVREVIYNHDRLRGDRRCVIIMTSLGNRVDALGGSYWKPHISKAPSLLCERLNSWPHHTLIATLSVHG